MTSDHPNNILATIKLRKMHMMIKCRKGGGIRFWKKPFVQIHKLCSTYSTYYSIQSHNQKKVMIALSRSSKDPLTHINIYFLGMMKTMIRLHAISF